MKANFFSQINISARNTFLPDGLAEDPDAACGKYDQLISDLGGIDLQLLGLGKTGHIGFNEPGENFDKMTHRVALNRRTIEDNARFFASEAEVPRYALTMGIKAIMQAKKILLVVSGTDKADILKKALYGPVTPEVPASILQMHPNVTVVTDKDAMKSFRQEN
jgi:glucosamine-6-phosphate deaminase